MKVESGAPKKVPSDYNSLSIYAGVSRRNKISVFDRH